MNETITPVVGMGVTGRVGSDSHAYTIVEVLSPRRIAVTADTTKLISGDIMSEDQRYSYESNPNGTRMILSLRKDKRWHRVGEKAEWWNSFHLGHRRTYRDPCF